jgi:hypothetical protein
LDEADRDVIDPSNELFPPVWVACELNFPVPVVVGVRLEVIGSSIPGRMSARPFLGRSAVVLRLL